MEDPGIDHIEVLVSKLRPLLQAVLSIFSALVGLFSGSAIQQQPSAKAATSSPDGDGPVVIGATQPTGHVPQKAAPQQQQHQHQQQPQQQPQPVAKIDGTPASAASALAASATASAPDRLPAAGVAAVAAAAPAARSAGAGAGAAASAAGRKPNPKPEVTRVVKSSVSNAHRDEDEEDDDDEDDDDDDEDDDEEGVDDLVKAFKSKTTASSSSSASVAAAAAAAAESERLRKSVQFILPEATPENDSDGVWEVKKGKKASETAEQRAKRLQRQKDAKLAKKLALEQEALDKKAAEERALQERFQADLEERAAKDAAHIAQIAESKAAERRRLDAEAKVERDMIERATLESLQQEQQRALLVRRKDEEMRAALAASLAATQAPPAAAATLPQNYTAGAVDLYLSANGGMPTLPQLVPAPAAAPPTRPGSHVDSSIADLQLNIFKLKQALQIPPAPVEFHTYSGGTLTKVAGMMPPPLQAGGGPAPLPLPMPLAGLVAGHVGGGPGPALPVVAGSVSALGGAPGLGRLALAGASGDPRPMVTMVGGELLDWLVPFHTKFEFVSRLPSPRLTAASGAETPDILIYQFEFPAGMGLVVAGRNADKLHVLQRSSGCVLTVNYDEDTRGWAKDDEVLRAGTLRVTGTITTVPNFVKLFDAQMLGSLEYLQSRKFVPKGGKRDEPAATAAAAAAAAAAPLASKAASAPAGRPSARGHDGKGADGGDGGRTRGTAAPGRGSPSREHKPRDGAQKGATHAHAHAHAQRANGDDGDEDGDDHADVAGAYQSFFEVPEEHTGYVIGKQGVIIKSLMIKTGTFIALVSPNPMKKKGTGPERKTVTPNAGMSRFKVRGAQEDVEAAIAQFRRNLSKIDVDLTVLP